VLIGSHVSPQDPLAAAAAENADVVQIFLGNPQSWKAPKPRDDAAKLKAAALPIYVHAPYLINVASANNRVRIPSRKILQDTCNAAADIGAAAVIVAGADCGLSGVRILATRSVFYPDTEEMMGWDISEKGFRIVLSREIPNLVRDNLAHDLDDFLAERGLVRSDITSWALHTGGPKILEATAEALGLKNGELDVSWQCLRRTGNLSSASVLVVLEEVMKNRRPEPGTLGLLAAMGPGFCSEFVLLEW